jgi:hypothetical protein
MTCIFVLKIAGKVVSEPYVKRGEAIDAARRRKGAEVWYVATEWREDPDKRQILPEKDRAKGPSAHLKGMRSKTVRHYVPCGVEQARVF